MVYGAVGLVDESLVFLLSALRTKLGICVTATRAVISPRRACEMRQVSGRYAFACLAGKFEVAKAGKDECQGRCTESAGQFENDTEIACQERDDHGADDET